MQNQKEVFEIDPQKHLGRWNYLRKSIIEIVKVFHKQNIEEGKQRQLNKQKEFYTAALLLRTINDIDGMISASIVRLLCYEKKYADKSLCREFDKSSDYTKFKNMYRIK